MASIDRKVAHGAVLESTSALTPASTVTLPEKCALSNTTTVYEHNLEAASRSSKESATRCNPFETDIEAMGIIDSKVSAATRTATRRTDAQVWPCQDHWKQKAKLAKKARSCTPLANMSPRSRIITKVIIGILIIGIAVAVGFGVSKPLGAPIWGDN